MSLAHASDLIYSTLADPLLDLLLQALAYLDMLEWVTIATATAAATTSWNEFTDAGRKAERYTRALYSLRKLLAWWASLGQVERASREAITHLISSSEAIIADERLAWMSTSNQAGKGEAFTKSGVSNTLAAHLPCRPFIDRSSRAPPLARLQE